ncbi:UNKNOWN [Stylonychia lemnae]|uniref:Uncharacterized protein n=1 Tax=Stylonychia lemnae TaxID=5949 RepID=A0A077ZU27_STYLE|nr:UNKNOWN [Stylonychia lemnae]|eukprot:CDW73377.1 UNKNOWN [Stylonychia lemnae]
MSNQLNCAIDDWMMILDTGNELNYQKFPPISEPIALKYKTILNQQDKNDFQEGNQIQDNIFCFRLQDYSDESPFSLSQCDDISQQDEELNEIQMKMNDEMSVISEFSETRYQFYEDSDDFNFTTQMKKLAIKQASAEEVHNSTQGSISDYLKTVIDGDVTIERVAINYDDDFVDDLFRVLT